MKLRSILTLIWIVTICGVALFATPWVRNSAQDGNVRVGFAPVWSTSYTGTTTHPDWVTVMLALFVAFALPATLGRRNSGERTHVDFSRPAVQPAVRPGHAISRPGIR